jgi:hypothetical protein
MEALVPRTYKIVWVARKKRNERTGTQTRFNSSLAQTEQKQKKRRPDD